MTSPLALSTLSAVDDRATELRRLLEQLDDARAEIGNIMQSNVSLAWVAADLTKQASAYRADAKEQRGRADQYRDERDEALARVIELTDDLHEARWALRWESSRNA